MAVLQDLVRELGVQHEDGPVERMFYCSPRRGEVEEFHCSTEELTEEGRLNATAAFDSTRDLASDTVFLHTHPYGYIRYYLRKCLEGVRLEPGVISFERSLDAIADLGAAFPSDADLSQLISCSRIEKDSNLPGTLRCMLVPTDQRPGIAAVEYAFKDELQAEIYRLIDNMNDRERAAEALAPGPERRHADLMVKVAEYPLHMLMQDVRSEYSELVEEVTVARYHRDGGSIPTPAEAFAAFNAQSKYVHLTLYETPDAVPDVLTSRAGAPSPRS